MYFLFLALLSLAITFFPSRISLTGRILGLLGACSNYLYGMALVNGAVPSGLGVLRIFVDLNGDAFSPVGLIASSGVLLTIWSAFFSGGYPPSLSKQPVLISVPPSVRYGVLIIATVCTVAVMSSFGISHLVRYEGYGSTHDLVSIYGDDRIGLFLAMLMRPSVLILIILSINSLATRDSKFFTLSLIPLILAFALAIADASRVLSVYFGVAAVSFLIIAKPRMAVLCVIMSIISISFALESRTNRVLGLTQAPTQLVRSLQSKNAVYDVLVNVTSGHFVTSSAIRVAHPEIYEENFKLLSFSPLVDALDGFQSVKRKSEQRVLVFIPFNAFSESYLFGPVYFFAFWFIVAAAAYAVNSSFRFGHISYLVLLSMFLMGWLFASQYPMRNCLRYFYLIIAIRLILPHALRWWKQYTHNQAVYRRNAMKVQRW